MLARRTGYLVSLFMVFTIATACAGPSSRSTAQPAGQANGEAPRAIAPSRVIIAINGVPKTISEKLNSAGGGNVSGVTSLSGLLNAGMSRYDPKNNLVPQLAEAVPSIENGLWKVLPDGRMETTWKIRPGAQWHDGTMVTSDDLVFSLALAQDREIAAFRDAALDSIERVDAPDSSTLVVTWGKPNIQADALFTGRLAYPLPKHLLNDAYTTDKSTFIQLPYWTSDFVGAGPYKLREWQIGIMALLDANDQYVLGRPRIDRLEVRFLGDPNALMTNVLAGAVELGLELRGVSFDQAMQVKEQWRDGRVELNQLFGNRMGLFPNLESPEPAIVSNLQFRRALLHAIDRQQLAQQMYGGQVPAGDSYLSPTDPDYTATASSIVEYPYDPRLAIQMIESLGYTRAADGIFRDSNGQRLTVEYRTPGGDDNDEKTIQIVASDWQNVGVAVDQVVIPPQQAQDKQWRALFPAFEMVPNPGDIPGLKYFYSSEANSAANNYLGKNRSRYRNPKLDGMLDRLFSTIPRTERQQVLGQVLHLLTDQVVAMSLYRTTSPSFIGSRVQNVESTNSVWNAHEWRVE